MVIPKAVSDAIPGILLGGALGAGFGAITADEQEDVLMRGIMFGLLGGAAGVRLPPVLETGNMIKGELMRGLSGD